MQFESPPVPGTGRRGRCAVQRFALLLRSQGAMLSRVCDLQKEIATFLRQKNLPYADQFFDPRWPARLLLLTDITTHLSALNVKLHGKDILVTDMHAHITAFKIKLRLWEAQLTYGQLEHFPRLAACVPDDVEPDTCVSVVASQREEFASRSQESGRWLRTSSVLLAPLTFTWKTPLPPCRWSWWSYSAMMN